MFIKEVVLCGFKSYKETTRIQDFNPGYNVIVGRNGSGKSNFFAALEFALRSDSNALKPDERNTLLYHGQVSNNIAYVEVVFDNADRKLPYNTDTVVFRRVIGAKNDRFYVNKKESNNIKQFLDSAGITNPYYIVKQGKINEMASANEKMRLQVLYDISGSKIYDEKKTQTHKMLEECRVKLEDIDKLIQSIDQHLETMEEGSKELQKYLKWEKKKRALEYVVQCKEKMTIASKIEKLQTKHSELVTSCEPIQKCVSDLIAKMDCFDGKIITMQQQVAYLESKKRDIESEIPLTSSKIAIVENKLKDTMDKYKRSLHSEKNIAKNIRTLASTNDELKKLNERIIEIKNQEAISVDEYALCKTNMEKYKEKYGRTAQFATKSERDSWIRVEIGKLDENLERQNSLMEKHSIRHAKIEDDLKALTKLLKHEKEDWEIHRVKLVDLESSIFDSNYDVFLEKQKEMWNDSSKIDQQLNSAKENVTRLTDLLRKNGGNTHVTGYKSLQSILSDLRQDKSLEHKLKGYYGIVLENFTCHESRNVAVEVTAGVKLFNHIVENHEVSKAIMAVFNQRKLPGEISFISIAELRVEDRHYPENPQEGTSLIKEITFEDKVLKAMKYVFGATMLCSSLELATQNAKRFKINCVTTEGDKVLNQGPLTGGYYNRRMSKIDVFNQLRNENCILENLNNEKKVLDDQLLLVEKDIIASAKNNTKVSLSADAIRSTFEKIQLQKDVHERKLNHTQLQLQYEERIIETLNNTIKNLTLKRDNLAEEELTEAMSEKSTNYAQQMKRFRVNVTKKMKYLQEISSERKEMESVKKNLENSVVKMEKEIEELKVEGRTNSLEKSKTGLEKQLDSLYEVKRKLDRAWNDTSTDYSTHQEQVHDLRLNKDQVYEEMSRKKAEIDKITKELTWMFSAQSDSQRILAEIIGTIKRLGTIPSDVGLYEKKSTKELCRELKTASKSLKSLGKVNKKATEKLERATKVKEELLKEKAKYNAINTKIVELDETLDDKKGDAVFKVFQTIHQQFREIFLKLVPHGNIRMFLRTKNGGQVNAAAVVDVDGEDGKAILRLFRENKFEGLAIDVNFLGKSLKGTRDLRSLSGGQKSLISLALLLAIQRCDPVPLYIFDEVDQALDRKHRSAVAAVIKELSQNAQFICTTFSRQFIDKSDAAFGVFFRNQASKILPIGVDRALSFVKNETHTSSDDSNFENSSCENSQIKQNKDATTSDDEDSMDIS